MDAYDLTTDLDTAVAPGTPAGPLPDDALVSLAKGGSQEALAALYARYRAPVTALLAQWLDRHRHEADDLAGDVFVRLADKLATYRPQEGASFRAWLFAIARHRYIDWLRSPASVPTMSLDTPLTAHWTAGAAIRQEHEQAGGVGAVFGAAIADHAAPDAFTQVDDRAFLAGALARLTPSQRRIVALRHYEDCSFAQIGAALGQPETAVRQCYHRAIKRLRVLLTSEAAA